MNAKQLKVLVNFREKRQHALVDGCPDKDCKQEWHKALGDLLKLCDEAEKESRIKAAKAKSRKQFESSLA